MKRNTWSINSIAHCKLWWMITKYNAKKRRNKKERKKERTWSAEKEFNKTRIKTVSMTIPKTVRKKKMLASVSGFSLHVFFLFYFFSSLLNLQWCVTDLRPLILFLFSFLFFIFNPLRIHCVALQTEKPLLLITTQTTDFVQGFVLSLSWRASFFFPLC